ncbi:uncharacterized protein At4g04775-like [Chenopodium quinoa]|uniref:uncharacterized protein At4g04775-like n=1 Tax=Chenopodium quinoa TaxID=63459 RepID=UPI000B76D5BD|nr:uncharacterized protein At4g04775-like [Chenopodium quinoa]
MVVVKGKRCDCGFPLAMRTSWTHENPGRKFMACKFYNPETRHRGCEKFEWVDEGILDWQRDVTNVLVAEKHRLATDLNIIKARFVYNEHEDRLAKELEKLNNKLWRRNSEARQQMSSNRIKYGHVISVSVLISVVVSFMFVKIFG